MLVAIDERSQARSVPNGSLTSILVYAEFVVKSNVVLRSNRQCHCRGFTLCHSLVHLSATSWRFSTTSSLVFVESHSYLITSTIPGHDISWVADSFYRIGIDFSSLSIILDCLINWLVSSYHPQSQPLLLGASQRGFPHRVSWLQ